MFITLTEKRRHTGEEKPLLVNPANITYASRGEMGWYKPRSPGQMTTPREKADVTWISFTAGLHEEADSIAVLETLDEIKAAL